MTVKRGKAAIARSFPLLITILLLLSTSGCGEEQQPAPGKSVPETGRTAAATTRTGVTVEGANVSPAQKLPQVRSWAYQIQDQSEPGKIRKLAASRYDLLVIDQTRSLKEEEDYDSAADVAMIKSGAGSSGVRLVICYLDAGQAESYRRYWREGWGVGRPEWIVSEDPDGWDENFPVKFWRPEWKEIMKQSLDRIIDDGYDGVYLDWLEAYSFEPVALAAAAEGLDPRLELEKFVAELAAYARARKPGFIFIAQNAAELGEYPSWVELFDAIAQEHVWFDGGGDPESGAEGDQRNSRDETDEYLSGLKRWRESGKPVFNVEYAGEPDNVEEAYRLGAENGFRTYVTLRQLDSLSGTPPPTAGMT